MPAVLWLTTLFALKHYRWVPAPIWAYSGTSQAVLRSSIIQALRRHVTGLRNQTSIKLLIVIACPHSPPDRYFVDKVLVIAWLSTSYRLAVIWPTSGYWTPLWYHIACLKSHVISNALLLASGGQPLAVWPKLSLQTPSLLPWPPEPQLHCQIYR